MKNSFFVSSASDKSIKELVKTYKSLIEEEKTYIKQQCYDFSLIPVVTKIKLDNYIKNIKLTNISAYTANDMVLDNFLILKTLYAIKLNKEKRKTSNKKYTKKDYDKEYSSYHGISEDDKAYLYSTKTTREVLYMCSKIFVNSNTSLLDKISFTVDLENVDIYNKSVNVKNLKYIISNLSINCITLDVPSL